VLPITKCASNVYTTVREEGGIKKYVGRKRGVIRYLCTNERDPNRATDAPIKKREKKNDIKIIGTFGESEIPSHTMSHATHLYP
jgi:hypothetical protein